MFPAVGRSVVKKALRVLLGAFEDVGFPALSFAAGSHLPTEVTEQLDVGFSKAEQFSLNSPSLAIYTKSSVFTKTGDRYTHLVKTAFLRRLNHQAEEEKSGGIRESAVMFENLTALPALYVFLQPKTPFCPSCLVPFH